MPGHKNNKAKIFERYQSQRARSLKIQKVLSHYILSNNSQKEEFTDGMNYGQYLRYIQKNHIANLSDKNYFRIKNTNNRLLLKQTAAMLEEQENLLGTAENKLSYLLELDKHDTTNESEAGGK